MEHQKIWDRQDTALNKWQQIENEEDQQREEYSGGVLSFIMIASAVFCMACWGIVFFLIEKLAQNRGWL